MGVMLIADKLGSNRFGLVPKHPIVQGIKVVGLRAGKVYPGETFEWHADGYDWGDRPELPPSWASPTDAAGRALYTKADTAREELRVARGLKPKRKPGRPKAGTSGHASPPGSGPAPSRDAAGPPPPGSGPPNQLRPSS